MDSAVRGFSGLVVWCWIALGLGTLDPDGAGIGGVVFGLALVP